MAKSATTLASELLGGGPGRLDELRVYMFEDLEDDEEALDDDFMKKLYKEFSSEFDKAQAAITQKYGKASRTGEEDDDTIPLNGVFRFAIWPVGDQYLFAAAAHEDSGLPVLLMLGTTDEDAG